MSKTVVIGALILAAVLAGLALLVAGRERPAPVRGPILSIDPARVTEVRVDRGGGRIEAARRGADPGQWDIVAAGSGVQRTWPADPTRVRAALRILSTLEFVRPAEGNDRPGAEATPVVIGIDGGTARTLKISGRSLAGQALASVVGPGRNETAGWIGTDVRDMLVTSGPLQWRDAAALAVGPEVSRVSLQGATSSVSLGRVQGTWALREPIQEPAEPEAVAKLTTALGAVLITDFLDQGPPPIEQTGLDHPAAVLKVETDVRDAEGGPSRTITQVLRAGRPAGIGGKSVYAAVERAGVERIVTITADSLAAINTQPASYIAKRAVRAAAADVGEVRVQPAGVGAAPAVFKRTLDGWAVTSGETQTPAPPADAQRTVALLDLLTQTPAQAVFLGELNQKPKLIATVSLSSLGGSTIADVGLGVAEDGKTRRLVVTGGPVARVYGQEGDEIIAWLAPGP